MALFMKGQPLVSKLAALAEYAVLPAAMVAAIVYSPPNYMRSSDKSSNAKSSTNYASVSYWDLLAICYLDSII